MQDTADVAAPVSVLLDNSIFAACRVARIISVKLEGIENRLVLVQVNQRKGASWKLDQLDVLPTVAWLGERRLVKFFRQRELHEEAAPKSTYPNVSGLGLHLMENIQISWIFSPLLSTFFPGVEPRDKYRESKISDLCQILLREELSKKLLSSINKEKQNLDENAIKIFRLLCRNASSSQCVDLYHLWTAHLNNIAYFLTIDKKLVNFFRQQKSTVINCMPLLPTELLEMLHIRERIKLKYEYGRKYYLSGRPFEEDNEAEC